MRRRLMRIRSASCQFGPVVPDRCKVEDVAPRSHATAALFDFLGHLIRSKGKRQWKSLNPGFDDEFFQYLARDAEYTIPAFIACFFAAKVQNARAVCELPNSTIGTDFKNFGYFCGCQKL